MKNHSQDTSQIWNSLFISLQCSAAKTSPNLAKSIVILPLGPGEELQVPCRIQYSQEYIGSEGAFLLHSIKLTCCQANMYVTHLKPFQPACP